MEDGFPPVTGNADSGIAHGKSNVVVFRARLPLPNRKDDFAVLGELDCIADQVDQDLPKASSVA